MRENDLYKEVAKLGMPDLDEIKENIVSNGTKKHNYKFGIAIAACFAVAVSAALLINNSSFKLPHTQKTTDDKNAYAVSNGESETYPAINSGTGEEMTEIFNENTCPDKIVYNKLKSVSANSLACNCREVDYALREFRDIISLTSRDMNERSYLELYVLPDELKGTQAIQDVENYTELHTCQIVLRKPDSAKGIEVSFSSKGEPLRDCIYDTGVKKASTIYGHEMYLNGDINDGFCIATFFFENDNGSKIWFDVEFSEVSEEEMLSVLRQIVIHWNLHSVCEVVPITEPAVTEETPDEWFYVSQETTESVQPSQGYTIDIPSDDDDIVSETIVAPAWDPFAETKIEPPETEQPCKAE